MIKNLSQFQHMVLLYFRTFSKPVNREEKLNKIRRNCLAPDLKSKVSDMSNEEVKSSNFIAQVVEKDLAAGKNGGRVHTRFPPEPNGYLHIGHAKASLVNYELSEQFQGKFNLRFDDTNPTKEDNEFVESIQRDLKWLGLDWEDRLCFTSDYFDKLYEFAKQLIRDGKAYVDDLSAEEIRQYRGTLKEPGKNSPYRDRSVEENLELFEKMKNGELEEGSCVLRAKIDMSSPNITMRDPAIYRIKFGHHIRTGDKWCIYPMYDFSHCLSDALEGITHSCCSLEFENNRPLYDWFVDQVFEGEERPYQYEFARLKLSNTMMSKRKLRALVEEGHVDGWDDPRMPTLSGMRRRGFTASSIRDFCKRIGVSKANSMVDIALLYHCIREELNQSATRYIAVVDPIKVVITNFDENEETTIYAVNNPEDPEAGKRKLKFTKELYISSEDFMEDPPKKFFRLAPGKEVRFKYGYFVTCNEVIKDDQGKIVQLNCSYDPETLSGMHVERKVKGTITFLSAKEAVPAKFNLYENLFEVESPDGEEDPFAKLNPESKVLQENVLVEKTMEEVPAGTRFQFERIGYFIKEDSKDLTFNRIVSLKDSWSRSQKKK